MLRLIYRLLTNAQGTMAIEYALMASLVCIALITGGSLLGGHVGTTFNHLSTKMSGAYSR